MPQPAERQALSDTVTLFLCGDVMTGRGIDQILPHPGDPRIYEPYAQSALEYLELAERATGPIERPADFAYIWGDALSVLDRVRPDARIINLETAVTANGEPWPDKGIQYRMHPANAPCLTTAKIDCCVLANNHVLDWGYGGLTQTLDTLHAAGIRTAGAGRDSAEAAAPAIIELPGTGRVLVFAFGTEDSGVPPDWAAGTKRPGVRFLEDLTEKTADGIAAQIGAVKRPRDIVVASIHWGSNWGFVVPRKHREFAHRLIDAAGVNIVHGHSSHHPKAIEIYRDRPIFFGCGDFLNDYEGISGHEAYRGDLALMYFPTMDVATGKLSRLAMTATQTRHFRANRAPEKGVRRLEDMLTREGRQFGNRVEREPDDTLVLHWK